MVKTYVIFLSPVFNRLEISIVLQIDFSFYLVTSIFFTTSLIWRLCMFYSFSLLFWPIGRRIYRYYVYYIITSVIIRLILTQLIRTKRKCIRIIQTINDGVLTIPKGSAINLRRRGYSWSVCMYSVKDALCICTV